MIKFVLLTFILAVFYHSLTAQVLISAETTSPDPSAMLEVRSTLSGFLPPCMTLTDMNAIPLPAKGLMVYCTTTGQYHYNIGTPVEPFWVSGLHLPFSASFRSTTSLMGISNEGPGSIATFAINDTLSYYPVFQAQTFGLGNAGSFQVVNPYNTAAALYSESVEGNAIYASNMSSLSATIHARNSGSSTALSAQAFTGNALYANNLSRQYYTIWAQNDSTGPVLGVSGKHGFGIYAENYSDSSSTVYAINRGNYTTVYSKAMTGNALYTENSSSGFYTIWAQNNGTGPVIGLNATTGNTLYAHNASNTKSTIYAANDGTYTTFASQATTGNAIYAANSGTQSSTIYAKNSATNGNSALYAENSGSYPAIYGRNSQTTGDRSGGYFEAGTGYAWVAGNFSGTSYKITGTGSVSTIVDTPDNEKVAMFCAESPEILLTDYGVGKLTNGKCLVTLDRVFSNNIMVDDKNPMKVFIQLEGECNGVYVTNKSAGGFMVVELHQGNSDTPFSWSVVANRKDERGADGSVISKNAGVRFPKAALPIPVSGVPVHSITQ